VHASSLVRVPPHVPVGKIYDAATVPNRAFHFHGDAMNAKGFAANIFALALTGAKRIGRLKLG
jgi:hypothetical protein